MLSFRIAVRFLKSGRMQTVLIVAGIAVAISIQVYIGLLIGSLQTTLVDRTIGKSPQITITSAADITTIRDWESLVGRIEQLGATKAISATASANAFVRNGSSDLPILFRGFNFERADQIYDMVGRGKK